MKYIKLKRNRYDCRAEFLIAMNDWYKNEYEDKISEYYICPCCEGVVWSDEHEIIEINK